MNLKEFNKSKKILYNQQTILNNRKKEYLEKIDYFGNRRSKYALYKKFSKKYNLNKRVFIYIINQAHEDVGSPKRYELRGNRNKK